MQIGAEDNEERSKTFASNSYVLQVFISEVREGVLEVVDGKQEEKDEIQGRKNDRQSGSLSILETEIDSQTTLLDQKDNRSATCRCYLSQNPVR